MNDKIIKKMFMSALVTTALMEFSQVGVGLIDGMITALCLGADEMAAVGLSYPYYSICGVVSGCLAVGLRSRCTKEMGQGNIEKLNSLFSQIVTVGMIISIALNILIWTFAPQLAVVLGARGNASNLVEPTVTYLRALSLGVIPFIMSAVVAPVVQLDNGDKIVRAGTLAVAAIDIVFDVVAVKLDMGIWGIGLATVLGQWANFLMILSHFVKKERLLHFRLVKISGRELLSTAGLGTEVVVRRSANVLRPILINTLLVAIGGSMAVTISSIRNNILDFAKIIPAGIAGATAMLMSLFYGEANQEKIIETGRYVHRLNNKFSAIVIPIGLILSVPIAWFYLGRGNESVSLLAFAVGCTFIQSYFTALTLARVSYLQAVRRIRLAQELTMGINLVYIVAFSYLLSVPFGLYGVMAAGLAAEVAVLLTVFVMYRLPKFRGENPDNPYVVTDESLNIGAGDVISLEIRDENDASLLSEQIQLFCKGHKLDRKTSMFAGICAEEMAVLSLANKESDKSELQIRVVISDGKLVLRFRDNSSQFNIKKLAEEMSRDKSAENIGLKMITSAADDIQYYRTLESNNTLITLKTQ